MQLTLEEYESLVALSRKAFQGNAGQVAELEQWLREIEKKNGIYRDFVLVQWQELSAPLPPGTKFPDIWPPKLRKAIELVTRRIARVDVDEVLRRYASEPHTVLVTRDPNGLVGWTKLDDFFK